MSAPLQQWTGALGLTRRLSEDPMLAGSLMYAGQVDHAVVRVWGIIDPGAWNAWKEGHRP